MRRERGYPIVRYIQDRTVAMDTVSSIDLQCDGAGLCTTTQSDLAVSATGRRISGSAADPTGGRWANGGLIILAESIPPPVARPQS